MAGVTVGGDGHLGYPVEEAPDRRLSGLRQAVDGSAYEGYVKRQAQGLLDLIPREGVRPLYARAREWARERGIHDEKDPLATLLRFCREVLLPLPPFRVWLEDVARNPSEHLADLDRSPERIADDGDSLPVETRSFTDAAAAQWFATLSLYRASGVWKGLVRFHRGPGTPVFQTAAIFREDEPEEIRSRFLSFDEPALRAFLRSVRP